MTGAVFADTTFYVALVNRRDALHSLALDWAVQNARQTVTTEFVLLEVANFFKQEGNRATFAKFVARLQDDDLTTVIPADTTYFRRGLQLFSQRGDKEWSLTDCISFIAMNDLGIAEALTADHHFQQAGFVLLLK